MGSMDLLFEKATIAFDKLEHTVIQSEPSDLFCTGQFLKILPNFQL